VQPNIRPSNLKDPRKRGRTLQAQAAGKISQNEHVPAPDGFDELMPKTLATATVDRLLHHAHLVLTKGDSHRLAEALAGKGVSPLAT
jgi:IstB-like ATP binding protein